MCGPVIKRGAKAAGGLGTAGGERALKDFNHVADINQRRDAPLTPGPVDGGA